MRRARGSAQTSPALQRCAGRNICLPAKNNATTAATMKNRRYGSSTVRFPIHAPLNPREIRIKGPRQHVEANMAANPPVNNAVEPLAPNESLLPKIGEVRLFEMVPAVEAFGSVVIVADTSVILSLIARRSSSREGTPLRCEPSR